MHSQIYLHTRRIPTLNNNTKNFISTQANGANTAASNANKKKMVCTFQMSLNGIESHEISAKMWKVSVSFQCLHIRVLILTQLEVRERARERESRKNMG